MQVKRLAFLLCFINYAFIAFSIATATEVYVMVDLLFFRDKITRNYTLVYVELLKIKKY